MLNVWLIGVPLWEPHLHSCTTYWRRHSSRHRGSRANIPSGDGQLLGLTGCLGIMEGLVTTTAGLCIMITLTLDGLQLNVREDI